MRRLENARVAVFGAGGVGGYAVEALARSGVGAIDVIDGDVVSLSNINRQILATHRTVGRYKAEVAAERVAEINPNCKVEARTLFFLPSTEAQFDFTLYDYIIDAIDSVTGKVALVKMAKEAGVPLISAMGAGNKLDPTAFEVSDLSKTSVCPLARVMRRELKKIGLEHLKVVYSREPPKRRAVGQTEENESARNDIPISAEEAENARKVVPASTAFVPPVVGFILAGEVIKELAAGK